MIFLEKNRRLALVKKGADQKSSKSQPESLNSDQLFLKMHFCILKIKNLKIP